MTENLYQTLREYIPEDPSVPDPRSVHFLSFPEVKEEYFDAEIERQVQRMKAVIELTRNIRERHNLSLKVCFFRDVPHHSVGWLTWTQQTPLRELLVFHPDAQYIADVTSLQRYIVSELNVRDVVFTSDESMSGVRYRAVADWGVLGRKLRKDLARVKNALPNVSSDAVKTYIDSGKLTVDGIELVAGDLTVQRYLDLPPTSEGQYSTHTDNDVVVRLDVQVHPELMGEWLARELINRVQKLRKKAGLQATDDVNVYYKFEDGSGAELLDALKEHAEIILKTVRSVPVDIQERKGGILIIEEEQEVADVKFSLTLVRA